MSPFGWISYLSSIQLFLRMDRFSEHLKVIMISAPRSALYCLFFGTIFSYLPISCFNQNSKFIYTPAHVNISLFTTDRFIRSPALFRNNKEALRYTYIILEFYLR